VLSLRPQMPTALTDVFCSWNPVAADAGFPGIGRYGDGSKPKSPEVILLRGERRTSGDEWRRRESNPRNVPHAGLELSARKSVGRRTTD
jgi:hypothetical protein